MEPARRRRITTAVVPMIIGLIAVQRAAGHVRGVDLLLLFTGGAAFGVGLAMLLGAYRQRKTDQT